MRAVCARVPYAVGCRRAGLTVDVGAAAMARVGMPALGAGGVSSLSNDRITLHNPMVFILPVRRPQRHPIISSHLRPQSRRLYLVDCHVRQTWCNQLVAAHGGGIRRNSKKCHYRHLFPEKKCRLQRFFQKADTGHVTLGNARRENRRKASVVQTRKQPMAYLHCTGASSVRRRSMRPSSAVTGAG